MKIERLLALTNYLLINNRVTAQTLSTRFEVSTRTVMRDINVLSLAGIPVVTYYGADGGYEILDSYKIDRQIMGENDLSYIIAALQGLKTAFDNDELNETLEKMQAIAPDKSNDVVLDFGVLKENNNTNVKLVFLQRAINIRQRVQFSYTNTKNEEKIHVVEPVAIMYKWYNWYMLCYNPDYDKYRIYKLVRMRALIICEEKNTKMHNVLEAKKLWEQGEHRDKFIKIRMQCKGKIRISCEEYLNGTILEEYKNGDFLYEMYVPEQEHFWFGTIMAFADQLKVLEPPELIIKVCENCKQILKQYKEV